MKFSEKILQNLNATYFYNGYVQVDNVLELLNEKFCNFKQIVDKYKSIRGMSNKPHLSELLGSGKLFGNLIQNNMLTQDDLKYLLNKITTSDEIRDLCWNKQLIKRILNEFVLDKKILTKLNKIRSKNIFESIEYYNRDVEETLKLSKLNKFVLNSFDLNDDQRLELADVLKDSEVAQNRLIQIIDNNLQDQYDFESLKNLLTKDEEKNLKTKFNL